MRSGTSNSSSSSSAQVKGCKASLSPSLLVLIRNCHDEADFALRMKLRNLDLVERLDFYTVKNGMINRGVTQTRKYPLTRVDTTPRALDIELLQNGNLTRIIKLSLGELAWITPSFEYGELFTQAIGACGYLTGGDTEFPSGSTPRIGFFFFFLC